jgi:hypothetical protein
MSIKRSFPDKNAVGAQFIGPPQFIVWPSMMPYDTTGQGLYPYWFGGK